jgi:hypothetical protein
MKDPRVHSVETCLELESGSSEWTSASRLAVKDLCHRYAQRTSRPSLPLGYGSAFTCFAFDYKCPNTAPAILWAGSKSWQPLLEERPSLGLPVWPKIEPPTEREKRVLKALGQVKLAEADYAKFVSTEGRTALLLLASIAQRRRDLSDLAAALRISTNDCEAMVKRCQARGWVAANMRLTDDGHAELRFARKKRLIDPPRDISINANYYMPQSLRGTTR